jgi:hypothetical protein
MQGVLCFEAVRKSLNPHTGDELPSYNDILSE